MKIYLNLAVTPSRRERYALAWAVPTLVVGLVVLVYLAGSALRDFRRLEQVRHSLVGVQAKDSALRARETELRLELARPEFREMIQETEFLNQLINQRQFSLTELAVKVSNLMPSDVKLNGLGLAGSDVHPVVRFAVLGKSEKAVESFLSNLEDSKDFSDVTIRTQGFRGGTGGAPEQVALTCTARYVTGISPAGQ